MPFRSIASGVWFSTTIHSTGLSFRGVRNAGIPKPAPHFFTPGSRRHAAFAADAARTGHLRPVLHLDRILYVGINAGYAYGRSNWTDTVSLVSTGNFNVTGSQAGGTLGYNMQAGNIVFGLETDLDWSGVKGSTMTNCLLTCETKNTWLGTACGRIGYAFDSFLPFFGGGMAYGGLRSPTAPAARPPPPRSAGRLVGGVEYAFVGGWSAKLEYIYVDLGKASCNTTCTGGNPFDVKFNANIMRAGLNYKF